MKAKNIKEAKELIERYETITLEEIKNFGVNPKELTGFGNLGLCTLCIGAVEECDDCIYYESGKLGCSMGKNEKSYNGIHYAYTPVKLRNAYRARAKHMRKLIGYES